MKYLTDGDEMRNFKLLIEYDGTRYSGWEDKEGRDTIQGKIQAVLEKFCGQPVKVIGAGRTDAGVHAKGMIANVHMDFPDNDEKADSKEIKKKSAKPDEILLRDYMNRYLPDDICVRDVSEVPEKFHARYNAVGKTYCYTCYYSDVKPVFDRKYVYLPGFLPDIDAMRKAAGYLTGEHDYAAFCGNSHMKKSTVRCIDRIEILQNEAYITFTFHGTGFLQHQIRIMTGTLLEVGKGSYGPEYIKEILAGKNRELAGPTLPAKGLCLLSVDY